MKNNILKFAKGAASSGTLTIIGVCIAVVVISLPIMAVSFSAMALWKSPETVPATSGSDISFDSDGTPTNQGDLMAICPALSTLNEKDSAKTIDENLASYTKWIGYINAAAKEKNAPAALLLAILWKEHGKTLPSPTGECAKGTDCIYPNNCEQKWCVSTADAYGPFQFQPGTWWDFGMTTAERQEMYNSGKLKDGERVKQTGPPISDKMFDPARAALAAATKVSHDIDASKSDSWKDKLKDAVEAYNADTVYFNDVYGAYVKLSSCIQSTAGVAGGDAPSSMSKAEKVVFYAQQEAKLLPGLNVKPPNGYHTDNGENKVKYMNMDINDTTTVVPGEAKKLGWCLAFVSWVYQKAGYDMRPTIFGGFSPVQGFFNDKHTWTSQASLASVAPRNLKNHIKKGDIIVMHSDASDSGFHAGIVENVTDNGDVQTIEGNVQAKIEGVTNSDVIGRRTYGINAKTKSGTLRIVGIASWD